MPLFYFGCGVLISSLQLMLVAVVFPVRVFKKTTTNKKQRKRAWKYEQQTTCLLAVPPK